MPACTVSMKAAILNPSTRVKACGQLSDQMRMRGCTYNQSVQLIQAVFHEAGQAVPDSATVDNWFAEADEQESAA